MYLLDKIGDAEYATPDDTYRLQGRTNPWQPEDPTLVSWLVSRATYNEGIHMMIREFHSLDDARAWIENDMTGPVFPPDRLTFTGRPACRWCDCFQEDVRNYDTGCRLCRSETALSREVANHA